MSVDPEASQAAFGTDREQQKEEPTVSGRTAQGRGGSRRRTGLLLPRCVKGPRQHSTPQQPDRPDQVRVSERRTDLRVDWTLWTDDELWCDGARRAASPAERCGSGCDDGRDMSREEAVGAGRAGRRNREPCPCSRAARDAREGGQARSKGDDGEREQQGGAGRAAEDAARPARGRYLATTTVAPCPTSLIRSSHRSTCGHGRPAVHHRPAREAAQGKGGGIEGPSTRRRRTPEVPPSDHPLPPRRLTGRSPCDSCSLSF